MEPRRDLPRLPIPSSLTQLSAAGPNMLADPGRSTKICLHGFTGFEEHRLMLTGPARDRNPRKGLRREPSSPSSSLSREPRDTNRPNSRRRRPRPIPSVLIPRLHPHRRARPQRTTSPIRKKPCRTRMRAMPVANAVEAPDVAAASAPEASRSPPSRSS